jgi:hypothetical protein
MDMSFPFDIADSKVADGLIDHRTLLAIAISRQASGPTARLMLDSAKAINGGQTNLSGDPLTMRIGYFSNTLDRNMRTEHPSGRFYAPREKSTDQRFPISKSAVYQDVSANRKQTESINCISDAILAPAGQENLRHI